LSSSYRSVTSIPLTMPATQEMILHDEEPTVLEVVLKTANHLFLPTFTLFLAVTLAYVTRLYYRCWTSVSIDCKMPTGPSKKKQYSNTSDEEEEETGDNEMSAELEAFLDSLSPNWREEIAMRKSSSSESEEDF
ncbi:hypothetical protein PFISCL1PPCAC_21680, partial [Pristionchus fissidentatus]